MVLLPRSESRAETCYLLGGFHWVSSSQSLVIGTDSICFPVVTMSALRVLVLWHCKLRGSSDQSHEQRRRNRNPAVEDGIR